MFIKYLQFHINFLIKVTKRLILLFDKTKFVFLCNTLFFLTRKDVRFKLSKGGFYVAYGGGLSQAFKNKTQALNVYAMGLEKRAKYIGKEYFLNCISFNDNDFIVDCGANTGDVNLYFRYLNIKIE